MSENKQIAIDSYASHGAALTETQVAEWLGLSVATLRAWRFRQIGPRFVRFGRAVRYLREDVESFILASVVETSGAND